MRPLWVVIATCKRSKLLRRTLQSLAECERPAEYAGTIVVENGGQLGAEQVVHDTPGELLARYIYEPQGNKSAALNRVLDEIEDGLLVFTDDDVRFGKEFLQVYSEAQSKHPERTFFGGPTDVDYEKAPPDWLKPHLPHSARGWTLTPAPETITSPVFLGFNWAAYAGDLRESGGFDDRFGPGAKSGSVGQESTMQTALLAQGITGKYLEQAMVWHYVPLERSTPNWTLSRIYRTSIHIGYRMDDSSPRVFGWPRWMLRELVNRYTRAVVGMMSRDEMKRFQYWSDYWSLRGQMKGCRLAYIERNSVGRKS